MSTICAHRQPLPSNVNLKLRRPEAPAGPSGLHKEGPPRRRTRNPRAGQLGVGVGAWRSFFSGEKRGAGATDLAGVTLDDNVSTLAERGALHGVGEGRSRAGRLERLHLVLLAHFGDGGLVVGHRG